MINVSSIAFGRFLRARAATVPNLPDQRVTPPVRASGRSLGRS